MLGLSKSLQQLTRKKLVFEAGSSPSAVRRLRTHLKTDISETWLATSPQEQATEPYFRKYPTRYDQASGNRLQRFYVRASVGVLGLFAECGSFVTI
jgi:hypothetical protein